MPSAISGRREAAKVQNRQAILVAAREVFVRLGYAGATVRDIIRSTSLASGTFYNYFKSKEDIYQALGDDAAAAIRPRLSEARAQANTAEAFLNVSFRMLFELAAAIRSGTGGGDSLRVRMDSPEVVAAFADLVRDIDAAIRRGLFARSNAKFLAAAITGTAFELSEHMTDGTAAAALATALFLGGIGGGAMLPGGTPAHPSAG